MITSPEDEPENLEQLLEKLSEVGLECDEIRIGDLLDATGRRSFGPVVLLVGFILVTPLSGIPGLPTLMGMLVLLTLGQILFGRSHFWVPAWLTRRKVPRNSLLRAIDWLKPWARKVDRPIRPRLVWMVKGPGLYATVLVCMAIGLVMPATEVVPFSASIAGLALCIYGLAMVSRDGLLALVAWCITVIVPWMLVNQWL